MYKVGDRVKCKKNKRSYITGLDCFLKNEECLVRYVDDTTIQICKIDGTYNTSFEYEKDGSKSETIIEVFSEYFYSKKELRDIKIKSVLI
jgi:hypothetical protein